MQKRRVVVGPTPPGIPLIRPSGASIGKNGSGSIGTRGILFMIGPGCAER
jgi:hypothetical protein